jgi:AhpD family alkylhydroperoxidase
MTPRVNASGYIKTGLGQAMLGLQRQVESSGIEHSLLELVKMRASQINGCAYCLDMHSKDARALGETEQRIYALSAWRETPFFSDRERAALEWTEAVTLVASGHVPDSVYEAVVPHFSEPELVALTFAAVTINAWNRLAISFRAVPGSYVSPHAQQVVGVAAGR